MLRLMDAAQALADLTEISSQVVQVAVIDRDGSILSTTIQEPSHAERFVHAAAKLLEEAASIGQTRGLPVLSQIEASTLDGSVFAVRRDERMIVATTRPDPTVGLVFYDLKHCLGSIEDQPSQPPARAAATASKTRATRKKADASA
jgi:predicted regulator of Ras-like GTPase activity (Roadblock/LC7/MglB family)